MRLWIHVSVLHFLTVISLGFLYKSYIPSNECKMIIEHRVGCAKSIPGKQHTRPGTWEHVNCFLQVHASHGGVWFELHELLFVSPVDNINRRILFEHALWTDQPLCSLQHNPIDIPFSSINHCRSIVGHTDSYHTTWGLRNHCKTFLVCPSNLSSPTTLTTYIHVLPISFGLVFTRFTVHFQVPCCLRR